MYPCAGWGHRRDVPSGPDPPTSAPRGRGRATAERGRPPLLGWVQRRDTTAPAAPAAPVDLAVLDNGRTAPITPLIAAKVQVGAPFVTDTSNMDQCTAAASDHGTGTHGAGADARRDPAGPCVHGNTREGLWSSLRTVLDRFTGISPRVLHLRVARAAFLPNHGHGHGRQTFAAPWRSLCSTTGDEWRRMAHQHRRMPRTLCDRCANHESHRNDDRSEPRQGLPSGQSGVDTSGDNARGTPAAPQYVTTGQCQRRSQCATRREDVSAAEAWRRCRRSDQRYRLHGLPRCYGLSSLWRRWRRENPRARGEYKRDRHRTCIHADVLLALRN